MNTIVQDNKLVAFGRKGRCPNCNNVVIERVMMPFLAQGIMYMPYIKDRFGIEVICPICHVSTVNEDQDVGEIIEDGKEITLRYYQDQNWFSKKSLLRDLKKLGFKDLAIYLQTMST